MSGPLTLRKSGHMRQVAAILIATAIVFQPSSTKAFTDCLALVPGKDGRSSLQTALPKAEWEVESRVRWSCTKNADEVLLGGANFCGNSDFQTSYLNLTFSENGLLLDVRVGLESASESAYGAALRKVAQAYPDVPRSDWPEELIHDLNELPFNVQERLALFQAPGHLVILRRSGLGKHNPATGGWDDWKWHNSIRLVQPFRHRSYLAGIWHCAKEAEAEKMQQDTRR